LLGFSPSLSPKDAETQAVRVALAITTIGITLTASIFALQGSLSLPHAMVVVSLLTQSLYPNHFIEPWIVPSPGLYVSQQARLFAYTALSLWLALRTPCLGSTPQCNLCTDSFSWFFQGKAINHFRRASLIFSNMIVMILWLGQVFWFLGPKNYLHSFTAILSEERRNARIEYIEELHNDVQSYRAGRPKSDRISKFFLWYDDIQTLYEGLRARRLRVAPRKSRFRNLAVDFRLALRVPRVQRALIAFTVAAIFTYDTEKLVKLNLASNANEWGYGQISAMILCTPSVAGVLKLFASAWKSNRFVIFHRNHFYYANFSTDFL
jgi:hypothetical protein